MKKCFVLTAVVISGFCFLTGCGDSSTPNENNGEAVKVEESTMEDTMDMDHSMHDMGNSDSISNLMKPMNDMMNNMKNMSMTGDPDVDFASMMIEHHRGSLGMAEIEVNSGKDQKLKDMASKMTTMQKMDIQNLKEFIGKHKQGDHGVKSEDKDVFSKTMLEAVQEMSNEMKDMPMKGDTDYDFASMMIPHHQAAIKMAQAEVRYGKHTEIKTMAQKMIKDQEKEITELQTWLSQNK